MKELLNQLENLTTADWVIICGVLIAYTPLILAIAKDKVNGAGQNFYTWILWLTLDIAQLISTILAHGTYVMFLAFIPCCFIATLLVRKHRKPINDFEKIVVVLITFKILCNCFVVCIIRYCQSRCARNISTCNF